MSDDTERDRPSAAERLFGDFAPALVGYTDDVPFGHVWTRRQLSPKERSVITVAALTSSGNADHLRFHLALARDNGTMAAMAVAKEVVRTSIPEQPAST